MASRKPPKKRARIDVSAKDSSSATDVGPSLCQMSPNDVTSFCKTGASDGDATGDCSAPTGQLRAELESARRYIEQLRREKADEARRAREQSDAALRQLAERLRDERQRVIEQVRQRCAAESSRAAARHEREVHRLRQKLDRCRTELQEDRSGSGGVVDAAERARLLQKVAEAGAAKRRAEEALRSAMDADRQKSAEIRRLHEECRTEVARVSKEANVEIRRLLDELKTKDHQLALLDRNQYPDRGSGLPAKLVSADSSTKGQNAAAAGQAQVAKSDKCLKQADILQVETVAVLRADVERITSELKASETEKFSMKTKLNELNQELASLRQSSITNVVISDLGKTSPAEDPVEIQLNVVSDDTESCNTKSNNLPAKSPPKAVRFLLPGEKLPVLARETSTADDDDSASINSDVSDTSSSMSSLSRLSPDSTPLYDENIQRNYHFLLSEHLSLQRNVANLLSSLPRLPSKEEKITCSQDCVTEKESMKCTIETLKHKLGMSEETEYHLRQQLKDQQELNEELEFRLFELQECTEKDKTDEIACSMVDLLEKNQSLEIEVSVLRQKLAENADLKMRLLDSSNKAFQIDPGNHEMEAIDAKQKNVLVKDGRISGETISMEKEVPEYCVTVETAVDGGSDATMDLEEDQLGVMTCSMSSATSGFDDNSCASSMIDGEEMPSEETWNFDVHEEACQEPPASKPTNNDSGKAEQSGCTPARQPTITEEQMRQMEKIWLSRMEKLERRLKQAMGGEQRARDQMALLSEEKDRRIAALERQVDALEASDFRLSKTIHALEQLERMFNSHFSSALETVERQGSEAISESQQQDENCTENVKIDVEQVKTNSQETEVIDVVGHPCNDKTCVQCLLCQKFKSTIEQLHLALSEQNEVERRVRELEEGMQDSGSDDRTALEVVDFEAEYRELEALMKELKQVLVIDRLADDLVVGDPAVGLGENERNEREDGMLSSLTIHWNMDDDDDETVSMAASPDCEMDSPELTELSERNRLLEITEQYLRQQINDLEIERDNLRSMVLSGEATINDLGMNLAQLQTSEKSKSDEATRLRAKNEWLTGRIDGLLELVGRLEEADRAHRATAGELRLRAERHSAGEADLRRELDNAVDEQLRTEARCRRWVAQLEDERDVLATRVDELAERNSELEGREAALECRIRKLETVEHGLRCEVAELERALREKEGEVFEERLLNETCSSNQDDLRYHSQNNYQTCDVIAFLNQKLELADRSNMVLEERLKEYISREEQLQQTIEEYEKSESVWQQKVICLESEKKILTQKIDELQAQLTDTKDTVYSQKNTDNGFVMLGTMDAAPDSEELAQWVALDDSTHVDDSELVMMSPHWDKTEQITVNRPMEKNEENETYVKESNVSAPPEPDIASSVAQQMTRSTILTGANESYESSSMVSLKCTDQKPEVETVFADRKLIVIRASDIQRSRSADIFRPNNIAATSSPATTRAQSEPRDITDSWNKLSKTEQMSTAVNLLSPETHTGSRNAAGRPSLIPRILPVPVRTSSGCVGRSSRRSPAVFADLPEHTADVDPSGKSQIAADGRRTPKQIYSTAKSLIPRLITENRLRKNSCGDESESTSSLNSMISQTTDKSAGQNKSETEQSSLFLGSQSSTSARREDARREPSRHSSVSLTSSCPGTSNGAPGSRE